MATALIPDPPRIEVQLLDVLDGHVLGQVHGVVVDDPVGDEGVSVGHRDVEHLAFTGIDDGLHRAEVEVVVEHLLQPLLGG